MTVEQILLNPANILTAAFFTLAIMAAGILLARIVLELLLPDLFADPHQEDPEIWPGQEVDGD